MSPEPRTKQCPCLQLLGALLQWRFCRVRRHESQGNPFSQAIIIVQKPARRRHWPTPSKRRSASATPTNKPIHRRLDTIFTTSDFVSRTYCHVSWTSFFHLPQVTPCHRSFFTTGQRRRWSARDQDVEVRRQTRYRVNLVMVS